VSDSGTGPATVADSVTVTGHGAAAGTPDIVVLRFGAEATDEHPSAAFTAAGRAITAMVAALRAADVADADLQTAGASVNEWHEHGATPRYHGSQQLTAVVRDLVAAGALVGQVIEAGGAAARLQGMSFSVADTEPLTRAAREAAWHDAVDRARQYAALAGRQLGAVLRIAERPETGYVPRQARRALASEASPGMPVEAGENEIAATVEVEWALVG
jgi:hypothetical protein